MFRIIQSDYVDEFYTATVRVVTLQSLVLPGSVLTFRPALGRGYGRPAPLRAAWFQPAPAVSCLIFPCKGFAQLGHARVRLRTEISFGFHMSLIRPTWTNPCGKNNNWKATWEIISPFCCCLVFRRALSAFWIRGHLMHCNAIAVQTG